MIQTSFWEQESFYGQRDVIIVGSGFVGLWSAYYLKIADPKLKITIVDRGIIPTGASTRNAGFACFGSVTELIADTQNMGEDKMIDLVEMRFRGLQRIGKVFGNKKIGYEHEGGYELISEDQQMEINSLRSNIDWLNSKLKKIIKKEKAFRMDDQSIAKFGFRGVQHLVETGWKVSYIRENYARHY